MTSPDAPALVWFRRDLRVRDHAALYHALRTASRVYCVFVFDTEILDALPGTAPRQDRRVEFIHRSLIELDEALAAHGGGLIVLHDNARIAIPRLAETLGVTSVFTNHDYEPQAIARDAFVAQTLANNGRILRTFKDQAIFEKREILTAAGTVFGVFTPYKSAWLKALQPAHLASYPVEPLMHKLARAALKSTLPSLASIGFAPVETGHAVIPAGISGANQLFDDFKLRLSKYHDARDFPGIKGPSYLSVHLRFGTISIRALARHAYEQTQQSENRGASTWLSELIWRDFYMMILANHPHVATRAYKTEFDAISWEAAPNLFQAWCDARTGYPLVDAAMRQLNQTGYMHNRLRMVVASFLTKDLGLDWRLGEKYFAERLIDFDLSANNGGWQWAASTGCDAQPWFRIFNPVTQSEKFDPEGKFIRRYVPELAKLRTRQIHAPWKADPEVLQQAGVNLSQNYPSPIVEHADARLKALARYSAVRKVGED